jgi:hypothetical protein
MLVTRVMLVVSFANTELRDCVSHEEAGVASATPQLVGRQSVPGWALAPSRAVLGSLTGSRRAELLRGIQRGAGNASVARVLQRVPVDYDPAEQKKLIEDGIREKDSGKIKDIEENAYALANDDQAIEMVLILLNTGWVGPRDEAAIYYIWNSRGKGVIELASKYLFVWNMCIQRGVDSLWSIPDITPIKTEFTQQVAARARRYLDDNKRTVDSELKRYGLDDMTAAPSVEQGRQREKLIQAAITVKKAKEALAKMNNMLIGWTHFTGPPPGNPVPSVAVFNPDLPPPLPGQVPLAAEPGQVLATWDEAHKNYERAHAIVDHFTRVYPALFALRGDADLDAFIANPSSSDAPGGQLAAMRLMSQALHDTKDNIDKTYPLVNDPKGEFALELEPIHGQVFGGDPAWKDPFRQLVAREAIKEHGNDQFWQTMGLNAVGLASFVVAELSTGGLATILFVAAAGAGVAQAAASWDRYLTDKAAADTNMSKETALIADDKASDDLITAVIDTVMAFVDVYVAAKGGAKALRAEAEAEAKLAGVAEKEAQVVTSRAALEGSSEISTETGHVHVTEDGRLVSCFNPCLNPRNRWARTLADHGDLSHRLDEMETKAADGVRANAGKEARDALAREYATLDDALAAASTRTVAQVLLKGMNDLVARFPFLKAIASDESALAQLVSKRSTNALKGQLLEELDAARVRTAIAAGTEYADLAARAGRPVELIAGNDIREITFYRTKKGSDVFRRLTQFSDGIVGVRTEGTFEVAEIREAKAGTFSASKLEAETKPLSQLSDKLQREIRLDAVQDFREANAADPSITAMSNEELDAAFKEQIDDIVGKNIGDAGQPERDMERLLKGDFVELKDGKEVPIRLVGSRAQTKIVGITPTGVAVDEAAIRAQGLLKYEHQAMEGVTEEGLQQAADELLSWIRATDT